MPLVLSVMEYTRTVLSRAHAPPSHAYAHTYLPYGLDVDWLDRGVDVGAVVEDRQDGVGSETKDVKEDDDEENESHALPPFPDHARL